MNFLIFLKKHFLKEKIPMTEIFIEWDGPYTLDTIKDLDKNRDYGLYQIYGTHPIYGSHVLLYIGKACSQTFGKRITQEGWFYNSDVKQVQIYVGRLFNKKQPSNEEWNILISKAEQLLIYSHWPAGNSSNINSLTKKKEFLEEFKDLRIYNYDCHRNLMPEVSGQLYIGELDWFEDKCIFSSEKD